MCVRVCVYVYVYGYVCVCVCEKEGGSARGPDCAVMRPDCGGVHFLRLSASKPWLGTQKAIPTKSLQQQQHRAF